MQRKKDHIMAPYRVPEELAVEYQQACEYFGLQRTAMARALMLAVIVHYKRKDRLLFPITLRVYGDGFPEDA
jgi:hypothetical protein